MQKKRETTTINRRADRTREKRIESAIDYWNNCPRGDWSDLMMKERCSTGSSVDQWQDESFVWDEENRRIERRQRQKKQTSDSERNFEPSRIDSSKTKMNSVDWETDVGAELHSKVTDRFRFSDSFFLLRFLLIEIDWKWAAALLLRSVEFSWRVNIKHCSSDLHVRPLEIIELSRCKTKTLRSRHIRSTTLTRTTVRLDLHRLFTENERFESIFFDHQRFSSSLSFGWSLHIGQYTRQHIVLPSRIELRCKTRRFRTSSSWSDWLLVDPEAGHRSNVFPRRNRQNKHSVVPQWLLPHARHHTESRGVAS